MKTYRCTCGQTLFYENSLCLSCGSELGFCPTCRNIVALQPTGDGQFRCGNDKCGATLAKCANYVEHNVCNRCVAVPSSEPLCDCCRFNDTIPDLTVPGNKEKWYRLEMAKRRLFYGLAELGLPYGTEADGIEPPLRFDFKADVIPQYLFWRPVGKGERVYTGHAAGRITINVREVDDVEREKLRVDLGEAQRTLIGHFRHEIGHFYWDVLVKGRREAECIAVFGDHNNPTYSEALETYYKNGPAPNWAQNYISGYATMHPWEDFAETWAAYLDMANVLETAEHAGFGGATRIVYGDIDPMIERYQELGIALNEFNRGMGLLDVVPEVFVPAVVDKLRFIHKLVRLGRGENRAIYPDGPPPALVEPSESSSPMSQSQSTTMATQTSASPEAATAAAT
ncbi:MAG: putative zinc-binding metallopeptidase [Pirellulales bacterium]